MNLLSGKGLLLCFFTFATFFPPPTQGISCGSCSNKDAKYSRLTQAAYILKLMHTPCTGYSADKERFIQDCSKLEPNGSTWVCGASLKSGHASLLGRRCMLKDEVANCTKTNNWCGDCGNGEDVCWCEGDRCEPPIPYDGSGENREKPVKPNSATGLFGRQSSSLSLGGVLLGLGIIYWIRNLLD